MNYVQEIPEAGVSFFADHRAQQDVNAIEIFFRFYKQLMGGSHLISHDDNGIEIQVYCSMIACLLINLWTGSAPNKRTFEMISYYFQGLASEEELLAHIEKQKRAAEAKAAKLESAKNL